MTAELGDADGIGPRTIWTEVDDWAREFNPWQRFVLCHTVRSGGLTEEQISQVYSQFLYDHGLAGPPDPPLDIPTTIAGRPATAAQSATRLKALSNLRGINALPNEAGLTFSPALTVVYGGNGVGKSGFARILFIGCFCRKKTDNTSQHLCRRTGNVVRRYGDDHRGGRPGQRR